MPHNRISAISTGIFGYPREDAAEICSAAISEFLAMDSVIEKGRPVLFNEVHLAVFLNLTNSRKAASTERLNNQ
jgi:O-acetyl-ADP-ribose deacetylase (regulator of RNase III)